MAKQTLGYVELEWECPSCHTRNKGSAKTCAQCGAPHPEETGYQQAAQEKILTDEAKIAEAKAGPDIYCAYCGAANPATRTTCKQCGSDLAEGKPGASGQVLGALRSEEAVAITCPACGASNPATAFKCSQCGSALRQAAPQQSVSPAQPARMGKMLPFVIAGIFIIGVIAAILIVLGSRKTGVVGEVSDVNWRRTIAIEALVPVTLQAWADNIPSGAQVGRCWQAVYKIQDQPAAGAREVCGTPYVVDKGSGYGEVQRDCQYEIYADRCEYQSTAWRPIAPIVVEGSDLNPVWPSANLTENQRATGRSEDFLVTFDVDGKTYNYRPSRQEDFAQYNPGSQWRLRVNSFGSVSVEGPR